MAASGVFRRLLVTGNRAVVTRVNQAVVKVPRWPVAAGCCSGSGLLCPSSRLAWALYSTKAASGGKPAAAGKSGGSAAAAKPAAVVSKSGAATQTDAKSSDSSDSSDSSSDDETPGDGKARRQVVDVETSMTYLKSSAFREAYGDKPVWFFYRRNHKGGIPPSKTRKTCLRGGNVASGNPCPVCRDEYLVLHHKNVDLLRHFVSEDTGEVLSFQKTGICQKQHKALLVAVEQAQDLGYLKRNVPLRMYDYAVYYPWLQGNAGTTDIAAAAAGSDSESTTPAPAAAQAAETA